MIEIDGSFGEGGGQILRTAVSLSAITKTPCRVFNIRKKRPQPGLQVQHLEALKALTEICGGQLEGGFLNSQEIRFWPGNIIKNQISVKIETAGSIILVAQTLIPICLFSKTPVKIEFNGGATDTFFAPTADYFRFCFLKIMEKFGAKINLEIIKRGYYPSGGAKAILNIFPSELKPINLTEKGGFKKLVIISGASLFLKKKRVAERQIIGAREILKKLNLSPEEKIEYDSTDCPGSHICVFSEYNNTVLGSDNLGKLGKKSEEVGKEAALNLLKEEASNACLDQHLGDQILIYLPLGKKEVEITVSKITSHCLTNIQTIENFIPGKFEIKENRIKWIPPKK